MDTLWAPWRLAYLRGERDAEPPAIEPRDWPAGSSRECFLCRAAAADGVHDRALGVLQRTATSLVIVNRFPYGGGHLLVAPLDHRAALDELSDGQLLDMQRLLGRWCRLSTVALHADGFNVGLNLGAVAGAGVPGHLHWHLLPRWLGDVNFMPALAGVRVISQALDALWEQLTAAADRTP